MRISEGIVQRIDWKNNMDLYLETEDGELEVTVDYKYYSAIEGKFTGPWEDSYDSQAAEVEIISVKDTEGKEILKTLPYPDILYLEDEILKYEEGR